MKNRLKLIILSISTVSLLGLAGCTKYKPKPMAYTEGGVQQKGEVEVSSKPLSDLDCKSYFDRKIVSKGYQPIQISIKNKSNKTLVLNGSNISLPLEKVKKVSKKAHYNTVGRSIGWGIGGLFFWPLFIPAVVEGISSTQANAEMDEDFVQRSIDPQDQVLIGPHSVINKVMFVPTQSYNTHYSMDLVTKDDGSKLSFNM